MNAVLQSPAPAEVTAENVEQVLADAGHHGPGYGLLSKAGEFDETFHSDKTCPAFDGAVDFPFDEIFRRLDGEPEPPATDTSMTRADVAKLLHDLMGWIVTTKARDTRAVKLAGSRALAAAWVLNPKLLGDVPGHAVAKSHGLHHDKFSKKAAEFSREFCIQNEFQTHDSKNQWRAVL